MVEQEIREIIVLENYTDESGYYVAFSLENVIHIMYNHGCHIEYGYRK